jgi:hypothetical protein
MSHNLEALKAVLRDMPREDRLMCLAMAIIEEDSDPLTVSLKMVGATWRMSRGLSQQKRFRVALALRDSADHLERAMEQV